MDQPRKGGILKGSKARMHNPISMNGDAASISSMHSGSTQASVYAPTFNPSNKPTSDWYDTINDSDTSMSEPNGRLSLNVGSSKPMGKIVEGRPNLPNQASNLATIPSNLAPTDSNMGTSLNPLVGPHVPPPSDANLDPNLATNSSNFSTTLSRHGSLHAYKPSIEDNQGYFSDASSTNSSVRTRLAYRLYSHLPASRLEPSICEEETPKHQNPAVIVNLQFKERNFNFDFENVSLTSAMGVQAFEELYGQPSAPTTSTHISHLSDRYQSHGHMPHVTEQSTSSEAQTPVPVSHNIDHQSHTHQFDGRVPHFGKQSTTPSQTPTLTVANHNNDHRVNLQRPSITSGDYRETGTSLNDNNSISMSSKARSLRNSSVSLSSSSLVGPLEASASKNTTNLKINKQQSLVDQSTDLSSEEISSEIEERQGQSLERVFKMGNKGTFLLCIPKGFCMPEGNVKSICPGFNDDYDSVDVEDSVKGLWADIYQPTSFDDFLFHVQQAQLLRQLISQGNCPHIFFHGLSNYGKKSLIMALVREIFGPATWKVSLEKKEYKKKGEKTVQIQVIASKFHVELDGEGLGENARAILVGLFKEITQSLDASRVIDTNVDYGRAGFKVIVLYGIDKLPNDTQQLIRWLMDRYGDTCKLFLCCEHASNVLDSIKSRCQILGVDPPSQQEMVNVLQHIAGQEKMRVSLDFIMRIAKESNHNLRHAIESLEACKPSLGGQAPRVDFLIPTGWEDVVVELAKDILMEQTPKRMYIARNKIQSLLGKHVPPELILQSLAMELLRNLNFRLKKEICYWHELYENRLASTSSAIDKLEEFVAKIMSIYKKYKKAMEAK